MAVSERTDPKPFAVGLIDLWPHGEIGTYAAAFRAAARRFGGVRCLGCMQGSLVLVAAGGLDAAFVPDQPLPWTRSRACP